MTRCHGCLLNGCWLESPRVAITSPGRDRNNLERTVDWDEVAEIGNHIRHYYEVITADHVRAYVGAVRKLTAPLTRLRANITKRRDRSESPPGRQVKGGG